jgi:hypothetical protein
MGNRNKAGTLILIITMTLVVGRSAAQDGIDLSQQWSQHYTPGLGSPATATASPAPGSDVRSLPQFAPQQPPSQPNGGSAPLATPPLALQPALPSQHTYLSQPLLPAVFHGCWQGRVDYVDSLERLPGGAKLGFWTPKTYRLCYRRTGDGPFVLTFTEAGIEQNNRITNAEGRLTLLSSDGRRYASMQSDLNFDEYPVHANYSGASTFPVHEVANLDCRIESDGMHVKGVVTGWRDGVPWFRARWHTILVHQEEPAEQVKAPPGGLPE